MRTDRFGRSIRAGDDESDIFNLGCIVRALCLGLVAFALLHTRFCPRLTPPTLWNEDREMLCTYGNVTTSSGFVQGYVAKTSQSIQVDLYVHVRQITRELSCVYKRTLESQQFLYRADYLNATVTQIEEEVAALLRQYPPQKTLSCWYYTIGWGRETARIDKHGLALAPLTEDPGWHYQLGKLFIEEVILLMFAWVVSAMYICYLMWIEMGRLMKGGGGGRHTDII